MNERNEPFKKGLWLSSAFPSLTEDLDITSHLIKVLLTEANQRIPVLHNGKARRQLNNYSNLKYIYQSYLCVLCFA